MLQAACVGVSVLIIFRFFRIDVLEFWLVAFYLACVVQFASCAVFNYSLATIEFDWIAILLCNNMHAL